MNINEELKILYSLISKNNKTYLYDDIHKLNTNTIHNNGGRLYSNGDIIYKIYEESFPYAEEKKRNIDFLINNHIINTPHIYSEINSKKSFRGYTMEYIRRAHTFREGINDTSISYEDKINIIKDIYLALKELHKYNVTIGDIHLDNFLYKDNHGYIIDLDEVRFPKDEYKFQECYVVRDTKHSNYKIATSKINDNIKVAISSLSFLYNIDLESIISHNSLEEVRNKLITIMDKEKYDKIKNVFNMNELNYLDDYIDTKRKAR